jgi:hypothetical protein
MGSSVPSPNVAEASAEVLVDSVSAASVRVSVSVSATVNQSDFSEVVITNSQISKTESEGEDVQ